MMGEGDGFEIPSWEQIYALLLSLSEKIRDAGFEADVIVGVSRGGWIPARILSDLLEKPEIANVRAEFYVGVAETKQEPMITQSVSVDVRDKSVLVVDDVSDTGNSLRLVKTHLADKAAKAVKIATLYFKPWSITVPDYYEKNDHGMDNIPMGEKRSTQKGCREIPSKREIKWRGRRDACKIWF